MHQTDFSALSAPVNTESADPAAPSAEVCLEEKSITRLVDPPFFSMDIKDLIASGRLDKRKIEVASMIVVCVLALFCCLFAKGQNDKLIEENARLQKSYGTEATWQSQTRVRLRLQAELDSVRQQLAALTSHYRRVHQASDFVGVGPAVVSPPNDFGSQSSMRQDNLDSNSASNSNSNSMETYGHHGVFGRTDEDAPRR
jgi:hypothetical protein